MNIYATSDVHGFHTERFDVLYNREESILIDNGDFFMGSAQASYWNHREGENHLVQLANELKYDVMVPGNHDFDYGLDYYLEIVKQLNCEVISCNIFDLEGNLIFKPYTIIERGGKRYGIIGAMTSNLSQISLFENVRGMRVTSAPNEIKKTVNTIKDNVDVIIVSYHGGIERDLITGKPTQYDTGEDQAYRIANEVDGIDLLICGHQHRENEGLVNGTQVVQIPSQLRKIAVYNESTSLSWLESNQEPKIDSEYEAWLDEVLDISQFEDFISTIVSADSYWFEFKGEAIRQFKDSFHPIYPLSVYHFNEDEWLNPLGIKDHYTVCSNVDLGSDRLQSTSVMNVFDAYYHFMNQVPSPM